MCLHVYVTWSCFFTFRILRKTIFSDSRNDMNTRVDSQQGTVGPSLQLCLYETRVVNSYTLTGLLPTSQQFATHEVGMNPLARRLVLAGGAASACYIWDEVRSSRPRVSPRVSSPPPGWPPEIRLNQGVL
jgi:hypothetical protein